MGLLNKSNFRYFERRGAISFTSSIYHALFGQVWNVPITLPLLQLHWWGHPATKNITIVRVQDLI
jgi:hypothetical protein